MVDGKLKVKIKDTSAINRIDFKVKGRIKYVGSMV